MQICAENNVLQPCVQHSEMQQSAARPVRKLSGHEVLEISTSRPTTVEEFGERVCLYVGCQPQDLRVSHPMSTSQRNPSDKPDRGYVTTVHLRFRRSAKCYLRQFLSQVEDPARYPFTDPSIVRVSVRRFTDDSRGQTSRNNHPVGVRPNMRNIPPPGHPLSVSFADVRNSRTPPRRSRRHQLFRHDVSSDDDSDRGLGLTLKASDGFSHRKHDADIQRDLISTYVRNKTISGIAEYPHGHPSAAPAPPFHNPHHLPAQQLAQSGAYQSHPFAPHTQGGHSGGPWDGGSSDESALSSPDPSARRIQRRMRRTQQERALEELTRAAAAAAESLHVVSAYLANNVAPTANHHGGQPYAPHPAPPHLHTHQHSHQHLHQTAAGKSSLRGDRPTHLHVIPMRGVHGSPQRGQHPHVPALHYNQQPPAHSYPLGQAQPYYYQQQPQQQQQFGYPAVPQQTMYAQHPPQQPFQPQAALYVNLNGNPPPSAFGAPQPQPSDDNVGLSLYPTGQYEADPAGRPAGPMGGADPSAYAQAFGAYGAAYGAAAAQYAQQAVSAQPHGAYSHPDPPLHGGPMYHGVGGMPGNASGVGAYDGHDGYGHDGYGRGDVSSTMGASAAPYSAPPASVRY